MGWRKLFVLVPALGAVLVLSSGDAADAGAGDEKPFPFARTTILPSGGTFYVEGRVRIPKGIEITVQKDTSIVGRGTDATIEVVGTLAIHGVTGTAVPIENVTIEPQALFESVRVDMATFLGSSKGIVTPKDTPCNGRLVVLNCEFRGAACVDVTMNGNEVDLQRVNMAAPARVKGVDPEGASANKVKLNVLNCCSASSGMAGALMGGLFVERVANVTVRGSRLHGEKVSFVDCGGVEFDGNQVKCQSLEFVQSTPGRFGKTTMSNCDVMCERIVTTSPAAPGKTDIFTVDKCWFDGVAGEKKVRERWFKDKASEPSNGVTVRITKVMERPLLLAGNIVK